MTQVPKPALRQSILALLLGAGLGSTGALWAQAQPRPVPASPGAASPATTQANPPLRGLPNAPPIRSELRRGDWILAIINNELVTNGEVNLRIERVREDARRANQALPSEEELRKQIIDGLIDERVVLTYARDNGVRVDETDLDRAVQTVAAQNQLSVEQMRERLRSEGFDWGRFRNNVRDQVNVERTREREVTPRIRVSEEDIDRALAEQRELASASAELNLAQILIGVPDGAGASVVAERRAAAEAALARVRGGEPFEAVARAVSEDSNRANGGVLGLRPAARLPDLFVSAVRGVAAGGLAPELVRSGAGFHVLKVLERKEASLDRTQQTRARHILVRTTPQLSAADATQRLLPLRQQLEAGGAKFEDLARRFSDDSSAPQGGDLGWLPAGATVPEFEEAMNRLAPNAISPPVVSRFGVHLIQVLERREVAVDAKAVREQVRNVLREQRFEQTYVDWAKELRSRAYIELREPPP
jgi:peptidyl-prolyl cis-trans isomerase SurA